MHSCNPFFFPHLRVNENKAQTGGEKQTCCFNTSEETSLSAAHTLSGAVLLFENSFSSAGEK